MMDEKTLEQSMQLILHSGTGRSAVIEAIQGLAKEHDIEKARKAIEATAMMSAECDGQPVEKSILLIHAQDHFMTSLAVRDMAKLMIDLYEDVKKG